MGHEFPAVKRLCDSRTTICSSASGTLAEGPIGRAVLRFALPILYANGLQSLNTSINAIWIGHYLGDAALAAASNANTIIGVILGGTFGIPLAATILIGYRLGAGSIREAKQVVGTGATVFSVISVAISVLGIACSTTMLGWLDTPADALPLSVIYLRITLLALPFMYLYAFAIFALRGAADSKTPFFFLLLSVTIDIALNPLFIFGVGPISGFGIAGSALATLVAQGIGLTALVVYLYWRRHPLCVHRDELCLLRVNWSIVGTLLAKGIPMSIVVLVGSLRELLMISLVNRFGVDTTAAYGAAIQLWKYIQMPAFAIGLAVTSLVAQSIGANRCDRVHEIARVGVFYATLLTGALVLVVEGLGMHAFAPFLTAGSRAIQITTHINRAATWSFVLVGVYTVIFGVMRAAGALWIPLSILTVVLTLRFAVTAALLGHWGAEAIWWSFPASSAITAALAAFYYQRGNWHTVRAG